MGLQGGGFTALGERDGGPQAVLREVAALFGKEAGERCLLRR
jgi:hypothetical protein